MGKKTSNPPPPPPIRTNDGINEGANVNPAPTYQKPPPPPPPPKPTKNG